MFKIPKLDNDYLRLMVKQNICFMAMLVVAGRKLYHMGEHIYAGGMVLMVMLLLLDTFTYRNSVLVEVKSLKEMKEDRKEVNND